MSYTAKLLRLFILLWWIASIYWYVCEINHNGCSCLAKKPDKAPIVLSYNGQTVMSIDTPIAFPPMEATPAGLPDNWEILSKHLRAKPGQQLRINTYYTTQEARKSANPAQIAQDRAAQLLAILKAQGISSDQIQISVDEQHDAAIYEDNCFNCINLSLEKRQLVSNEDAQKLLENPTIVHFAKSQTKFQADSTILAALQLVAHYLQQEPQKKATIFAHTDEEGDELANMNLSEKRAETIKAGLVQMNVPAEQLDLVPKGQQEPKCPEKTPDCFYQNRRVEIKISE